MAALNAEKYNIAWFKLAEFVNRGEKERALGMYRLLSYSLTDRALSSQLEGDLLLSFRDYKAIEAYARAALLYEQQQKLNQASALYEHMTMLAPHSLEYMVKLVNLYTIGKNIEKLSKVSKRFVDFCITAQKHEELEFFFKEIQVEREFFYMLYEHTVIKLLAEQVQEQVVNKYIEQTIRYCSSEGELIDFIAKLAEINTEAQLYASEFRSLK
jgi:hypothetical protein